MSELLRANIPTKEALPPAIWNIIAKMQGAVWGEMRWSFVRGNAGPSRLLPNEKMANKAYISIEFSCAQLPSMPQVPSELCRNNDSS
ncbi:hypothetical protein M406DRAFT_103743 [Cryphonectria parasitica EP155]|uniref:Uncharacterized protein n=1 Tax=Cryphonectria parasitica (strain ATCC 38755 / EP155) TaxID=660469 RepID=A0A9P4XYK9_CRYP1|nr:uncharacterized protein M406DRAFT_103743 [Cryphonectria parasitica EP155]KAF3763289.1 hypothetical protein M406DRAFT_103743 [Cryphonectria parasitica EP155]